MTQSMPLPTSLNLFLSNKAHFNVRSKFSAHFLIYCIKKYKF